MRDDHFDYEARLRQFLATPMASRAPLIAITGNYDGEAAQTQLAEAYSEAVRRAGGVPVIIPPFADERAISCLLGRVDGLLLSGGADLNPLYVGEQPRRELHATNARRDLPELLTIRLALHRQLPILGICRGIQMLVCAMGGTIYQDIVAQYPKPSIRHSQDMARWEASHKVGVEEGSLLAQVYDGAQTLCVNSFHHQAVSDAGPHLRPVAWSTDGLIEAVESSEKKSILAVQWHPECLPADDNLFRWLAGEARSYREARDFHARCLTLDSHEDTPMVFQTSALPWAEQFMNRGEACVDLHKMDEGGLDSAIMVAYLPQGERDEPSLREAAQKADSLLDGLTTMLADPRLSPHIALARTPADLYRLKREGRHAVMLGVENGYAIGHDLSRIAALRARGVVYMTLCHNGDNDICDSASRSRGEHHGLSRFGREVVKEMNRVGMLVDLSHASEETFWQVLEVSQKPVVCTHSSARALCDHPRNLTDAQMKALAGHDGVAQITLYHGFLKAEGEATIDDAVAHILHAVEQMGIDHVGIGTDFDGDGGVTGVANASELINLTRRLAAHFTPQELAQLWGGNFLRVMEAATDVARF